MTYEAWTAAKSEDYYDRSLWFQAYEGEELVGFIITKNFKDHAFVDLLGVRRAWRKSGIALALLQSVYRACFDQGIHHVQLSVDASSLTGANRLYERAGMTASFQMGLYEKEYTKKYT
ncbi:TDP-fucosamine acetyltransferase [compost metagenome]